MANPASLPLTSPEQGQKQLMKYLKFTRLSDYRAQLLNAGLYEDGYEAIDFALKNIPFRDSPFIAKNIILITDEGRTPIPQGEGKPL